MEAVVCMWSKHIFSLGSIDGVTQDPTPVSTMCIHLFFTVFTGSVGGNAGNNYVVAFFKIPYSGSHLFNYTNAFMSQGSTRFNSRHFPFQNTQVSSADGSLQNFY